MNDLDKMVNLLDETSEFNSYSIKSTLNKGKLMKLEINSSGNRWIFDTDTFELIEVSRY